MSKQRDVVLAVVVTGVLFFVGTASRADEAAPPSDPDVVKDWSGSVALGLSLTQGNSKTMTATGAAGAEKLWRTDEFRLGVDGEYGLNNFGTKSNEVVNAENVHGFVDYKHLFNERLYGDLRLDAFHDDVADLQFRINVGPAVGYYFIKQEDTRLNAEIGPGYEIQRQNEQETQFFTLRVGERLEHSFSKVWKIWEEVIYLPKMDDFATYLLLSEAGTEVAMNSRFSLRLMFQDRYNSKPAAGKVPNDLAILASLVWRFGVLPAPAK